MITSNWEKEAVIIYKWRPFWGWLERGQGVAPYRKLTVTSYTPGNASVFDTELWGFQKSIPCFHPAHSFNRYIVSALQGQGIVLATGNIAVTKQSLYFYEKHVKWPPLQGMSQGEDKSWEERRQQMPLPHWSPRFLSFQRQAPLGISCAWLLQL